MITPRPEPPAAYQRRRLRFLEAANADYLALSRDKAEWQHEIGERRLWDVTLNDGLGPDEPR